MLERLIVGRIEHRLIFASGCFFAIFLIVGWVALNEEGRMTLEQQAFKAHSIEQGAQLYVNWCGICHGADGLGSGHAPILNNPQLFGHDFFPEITKALDDLGVERSDLFKEAADLNSEQYDSNTTDLRKTEINNRLSAVNRRLPDIEAEINDLNQQRIKAVQAAVDKGYDPAKFDRLRNVGWGSTLESFISGTSSQGRPNSTSYWPQPMPAFGEKDYPALQAYQIDDITAYVINWDKGKDWTLDDLLAVRQFAIEPVNPGPLLAQIEVLQQYPLYAPAVGTDMTQILSRLSDYTGDVERGNQLYHAQIKAQLGFTLPCASCHLQTADATAPMTNGSYTRIINERLKDPKLAGYTAEQYIIESIVQPETYVVPNFVNIMPRVFGTQLSYQDMADLVAYIKTMQ